MYTVPYNVHYTYTMYMWAIPLTHATLSWLYGVLFDTSGSSYLTCLIWILMFLYFESQHPRLDPHSNLTRQKKLLYACDQLWISVTRATSRGHATKLLIFISCYTTCISKVSEGKRWKEKWRAVVKIGWILLVYHISWI